MRRPEYVIGLDIAAQQFTVAIGQVPWRLVQPAVEFANTSEGFAALADWLHIVHCTPTNSVVCMEATGVYGEALAYWLVAHGWRLAVEPPLKVKRAFAPSGHKTDAVDSQQIAEYACRFLDELRWWQPRPELVEQLKVLLTTREQLVAQATAHRNALTALRRKPVRTALAEQVHQQLIVQLRQQVKTLEAEIRRLIKQEPPFSQLLTLLLSIPGVGLLLAAHILVLTQFASQPFDAKHLAAHLGLCPYQRRSGASLRRRARSRGYGPGQPRKLLHLAARSVSTHTPTFRAYYQRKLAEGKPKPLALNNVSNKLLKLICAVLRSRTPYIPNYRSLHPALLNRA
jgi:transposase